MYKIKRCIIGALLILSIFFLAAGNDPRQLFSQMADTYKNLFPDAFSCEISSELFDNWFDELPEEAFVDKENKPPLIYFNYRKNEDISYEVINLKPEYESFFTSTFFYLQNSYIFLLWTAEDILQEFIGYSFDVVEKHDSSLFTITPPDKSQNFLIHFANNAALQSIKILIPDTPFVEINFEYSTFSTYLVPAQIGVSIFETDERFTLYFLNHKIIKRDAENSDKERRG